MDDAIVLELGKKIDKLTEAIQGLSRQLRYPVSNGSANQIVGELVIRQGPPIYYGGGGGGGGAGGGSGGGGGTKPKLDGLIWIEGGGDSSGSGSGGGGGFGHS